MVVVACVGNFAELRIRASERRVFGSICNVNEQRLEAVTAVIVGVYFATQLTYARGVPQYGGIPI